MPRQLTILFPDGRTEFWLTALVFTVGDTIIRGGRTWVVTSIATPDNHLARTGKDGDNRHATVTVRPDDQPRKAS